MSDFDYMPQFQEDSADENPVGSLSRYIQKHMESRKVQSREVFPSASRRLPNVFGHKQHLPNGMVLDDIDTELASSHLAQYLPTASTRLYLKRAWIDKALESIEKALSIYENDDSQEGRTERNALLMRQKILKEKLDALEVEEATLNPVQSAYQSITHWLMPKASSDSASAKRWVLFKNPNTDLKEQAKATQQKMTQLEERLETQIHDPNLTPEDLTRMVNEFDKLSVQAEKQLALLKQKQGFRQKISAWTKFNSQK